MEYFAIFRTFFLFFIVMALYAISRQLDQIIQLMQ